MIPIAIGIGLIMSLIFSEAFGLAAGGMVGMCSLGNMYADGDARCFIHRITRALMSGGNTTLTHSSTSPEHMHFVAKSVIDCPDHSS